MKLQEMLPYQVEKAKAEKAKAEGATTAPTAPAVPPPAGTNALPAATPKP